MYISPSIYLSVCLSISLSLYIYIYIMYIYIYMYTCLSLSHSLFLLYMYICVCVARAYGNNQWWHLSRKCANSFELLARVRGPMPELKPWTLPLASFRWPAQLPWHIEIAHAKSPEFLQLVATAPHSPALFLSLYIYITRCMCINVKTSAYTI